MNKTFGLIAISVASVCMNASAAGSATAVRQYITEGQEEKVVGEKITVTITPDASAIGRPGSFYVGVLKDGMGAAYYANGRWNPISKEAGPVEYLPSVPNGSRTYVVFNQRGFICDQPDAYNSKLSLYAGYGVLTAADQEKIVTYHAVNNPRLSAEHIANSYMRANMSRNNQVWAVLDLDCKQGN